jgi:hypothetical protein
MILIAIQQLLAFVIHALGYGICLGTGFQFAPDCANFLREMFSAVRADLQRLPPAKEYVFDALTNKHFDLLAAA